MEPSGPRTLRGVEPRLTGCGVDRLGQRAPHQHHRRLPEPGFLQGLREVTRHYEVPLIFDEIVTGFRFAYGGAQEYYGVTPDLCTLGKAVGGGFPLSAVAGKEEIMDHFDPTRVENEDYILQIGTLNGNPIAAVAGLATLKLLRRKGTYERLFGIGQRIKNALGQHAEQRL